MTLFAYRTSVAALGLIAATAAAVAGTPYPKAGAPQSVDRGLLREQAGNRPISVTIALKLRDAAGAETLMRRVNTPGDAEFHHFLTPAQFQAKFGPTDAAVDQVRTSLAGYGLATARVSSTVLHVTGAVGALETAFRVTLHQYDVPASGTAVSYSFRAPLQQPSVPAEIAPLIHGVFGLDSRPSFHPQHHQAPATTRGLRVRSRQNTGADTPDEPGLWTVTDFSDYYDVTPLYDQHVLGQGRTVGIVTFASFTPSDAFAYWNALGLKLKPKRLSVVDVDGGPGAPSDESGSDETSLDVEQSGGIAPEAKIVVYQAPNTNQGFIDAFAAAIDSNDADTVSVSWGSWEWLNNVANAPVTDPFSGRTVSTLQATHELFIQAALQGQSLFAAAGDNGAYDVNDPAEGFGLPPDYSLTLSVDYPGSDTAITAAGGTTLGGPQIYDVPGGTFTIDVPEERVWGWNYLVPLCKVLGYTRDSCGIYPVGGGGGVSVFFPLPFYQQWLAGVQNSQPGQTLVQYVPASAETIFALPGNYAGRNVPDVSFNADPDTGYVLYYTSSVDGFGIDQFFGGTSFVAPQLNGVTALMSQYAGHRLSLLNFALYAEEHFGAGYKGPNAPLKPIAKGNNWFYTGRKGYSPAAGVGTIDVTSLAKAIRQAW